MKNIKDYLHLYIGHDMQYIGSGKPFRGTSKSEKLTHENFELLSFSNDRKLLLRPLLGITDEEKIELIRIEHPESSHPILSQINLLETGIVFSARDKRMKYSMSFSVGMGGWTSNEFLWLLSKGFDLFNLHEKGLCIYKSDLK